MSLPSCPSPIAALGHPLRQIKGRDLQTVLHHQGRGHGHGAVHRAHHHRSARRVDTWEKSGSRRRVVPDQTSSRRLMVPVSTTDAARTSSTNWISDGGMEWYCLRGSGRVFAASMKRRTNLLIACMGLAMLIAGCLPLSAATRHIVLLFDERVELPGLSLLEAELVRTLRSKSTEPIEVYRKSMDLSRFGSDPYETLLRDFLRAKYSGKKIDVVVGVMGPALDFLLNYADQIFPGTPIVFCGLDRHQLGARSLPANVFGVLVKREFAPTLELALNLHPATEGVVVVSGTSEFDNSLLAAGAKRVPSFRESGFVYLPVRTLSGTPSGEAFAFAAGRHRPVRLHVSRRHWPSRRST